MSDPIRDALTHLITGIDLLAAASEGVSGLDMNGGLEPWSSLLEGGESSIWLGDAIAAGRAALAAQPPADAQPPAPAASTTLDLDALLSPEGAYARGTGQEDGAQMVSDPNGPEWWAPLYGCETLDNLLDRLRARILPRLRPPVAGIDVPGPDGDYGDVMDLCAAEGVDYRVGVPLLKRARKVWKVAAQLPTPASEGELVDLAGCVEAWAARLDEGTPEERLLGRVAYVLRQRQALPHDEEVDALIKILSRIARMLDFMPDTPSNGLVIHRVIELLRQPAPAPAVAPVAVAERPWEREALGVAAQPPAPAPALDADTLRKVWREAAWGGRWATLADYVALAVEAQRAPSGNPPATEEYLAEARQEVAGFSPDLLARRLQNLARVQARDGREFSSALCARAAELITPASDEELYFADGRDDPEHKMHSYTGLWIDQPTSEEQPNE